MAIGASKLNEEKVGIIRDLLNAGDFTHQQIADLFEVSREMITHIKNGRRWNDDIKSFVMKSNDLRDFGDPLMNSNNNGIESITITYKDGREMVLR